MARRCKHTHSQEANSNQNGVERWCRCSQRAKMKMRGWTVVVFIFPRRKKRSLRHCPSPSVQQLAIYTHTAHTAHTEQYTAAEENRTVLGSPSMQEGSWRTWRLRTQSKTFYILFAITIYHLSSTRRPTVSRLAFRAFGCSGRGCKWFILLASTEREWNYCSLFLLLSHLAVKVSLVGARGWCVDCKPESVPH